MPRTPLIPGITDVDENIAAIVGLYKHLGVKKAGLMKNNPIWFDKIEKLGVRGSLGDDERLREFYPEDKIEKIRAVFEENGTQVVES